MFIRLRNSERSHCRSRIRCYSEVTSTPYSSHENLSSVTTDHGPEPPGHTSPGHGAHSPSAEAPELSASFIGEVRSLHYLES